MRPYEPYRGRVWRVIEGQYRPATRKITDSNSEQARLEELLEATKPPVPPECRHLDYQFSTPFRYGLYPWMSRFRRPGPTDGVFYSSEHSITAAIEDAWGKVTFFRNSPGTPLPGNPLDRTAIEATVAAPISIDLTHPAMEGPAWRDPDDYSATCDLADAVRADGCEVIRYASVRDPGDRLNVALLTCASFKDPAPVALETWKIFLRPGRVILSNETARETREYSVGATAFERV